MRHDLNLATRPLVNYLPHVLLLSTLAVLAIGLTAWNVSLFLTTRSEAKAVETQLEGIAAEERRLERRRVELLDDLGGRRWRHSAL